MLPICPGPYGASICSIYTNAVSLVVVLWFPYLPPEVTFLFSIFLTTRGIHYTVRFLVIHCAPDITRSLFCVDVVKDTPYLARMGETCGVIHECNLNEVFFCFCNYCAMCTIVQYITATHRESVVFYTIIKRTSL